MSPHQSKPDSHAFVLLHIAEPMATMVSSLMAAHIAVFLALMLLMLGGTEAKFMSNNITVVGSVYCDACSNNTFSKHSFFLKGARVLIQCNFKVNSTTSEQLSLEAERTTDQNGVYKLDVPPVDGFACREGHELRSACRATLVHSSSSACNVPGVRGSSTQHIALRSRATNACFLNLNALNFRPAKRDAALCHNGGGSDEGAFGASLFFWPFLPLLWPPFRWLPFPAPGGAAGGTVSFPWPFPVPQWLVPFLRPPFLPFPLYEPAPESAPPPPFYRFPPAQEAASRP